MGRAGRELDAAYGMLLSGKEETEITDCFIRSAFPTPAEVRRVIDALEGAPDGLSITLAVQGYKPCPSERCLLILDVVFQLDRCSAC